MRARTHACTPSDKLETVRQRENKIGATNTNSSEDTENAQLNDSDHEPMEDVYFHNPIFDDDETNENSVYMSTSHIQQAKHEIPQASGYNYDIIPLRNGNDSIDAVYSFLSDPPATIYEEVQQLDQNSSN